jgi:hypothetical protein
MPNLEPPLARVIASGINDRLGDDFKCEVGSVVKFYADKNEADVKLAAARPLQTTDGEVTYETPPILPHVPMVAFGTSRSFLQVPLVAGDSVLVLFTGQSPAEFLEGQSSANPANVARHGLSNGIGFPFVLPGRATAGARLALLSDVQAVLSLLKQTYPITPLDGGASWQAALITAASTTTLDGTAELVAK